VVGQRLLGADAGERERAAVRRERPGAAVVPADVLELEDVVEPEGALGRRRALRKRERTGGQQ